MALHEFKSHNNLNLCSTCLIILSGFDKRYLQKFPVRFNNLTLEDNQKQLKVASLRA